MGNGKKTLLYVLGIFGVIIAGAFLKMTGEYLILGNDLKLALLGTLIYRLVPVIVITGLITYFCKKKIRSKLSIILFGAVISFVIAGLCPFYHDDLAQSDVYGSPLIYCAKLIGDITAGDTTTAEAVSPARCIKHYSYRVFRRRGGSRTVNNAYCCIRFNDLSIIVHSDTYNELYALSERLDSEEYRIIYDAYKYKLYSDLSTMERLGRKADEDNYFNLFKFQYVNQAQSLPYKCTIEYYNGSKKIKSINGYDFATELSSINSDVLSQRVNNIIPLFKDAIAEYEAKEHKNAVIDSIADKEGTDMEVLRAEMTANDFKEDVDFKVVSINSKMYSIGTIVDLDYIQAEIPTLYVVTGDSSEDLLEFPYLGGLTKEEAIKTLHEAGFDNYIADTVTWGADLGCVSTVGEEKGTFVPKQKTIWFCYVIDK